MQVEGNPRDDGEYSVNVMANFSYSSSYLLLFLFLTLLMLHLDEEIGGGIGNLLIEVYLFG